MINRSGNVIVGVIFVMLLVVVGGVYVFTQLDMNPFPTDTDAPTPTSSSSYTVGSDEADGEDTPDGHLNIDDLTDTDDSDTSMLVDDSVDLDVTANVITLTDVTGGNSSGTATRSVVNNILTHTVEASLPVLPTGYEYEGWLVNQTLSTFISTGVMEKESDTDFTLQFTADQPYTGYDQVIITLESIALDGIPEDHVIEGKF